MIDSRRRQLLGPMILASFVIAVLMALAMTAQGAELADSGWQVATPLSAPGAPTDPTMRIAINRMLEETWTPLLQEKAPDSEPPTSNDGWRAADAAKKADSKTSNAAPSPKLQWSPKRPSAKLDSTAVEPAPQETQDSDGPRLMRIEPAQAGPLESEELPNDTDGLELQAEDEQEKERDTRASADTVDDAFSLDEGGFAADEDGDAAATGDDLESIDDQQDTLLTEDDAQASEQDDATVKADEEENKTNRLSALAPTSGALDEPLPPMPRNMRYLRNKLRRVLKSYYNKPLNSRDHDPWEAMHGMLSYGIHSRIRQGSPRGQMITAVGWLCYNRPCKRLTLLRVTPQGELRAKYGVGLQGHLGQFLAMLAQCNVSLEYPIRVGRNEFMVQDLIEAEMLTCYPKDELTFKLIALMHYLESDTQWVNDQGMAWDIPRLIREELAQPIRGAACGGTHRLAGLSLAVRTRVLRGEPLDGEYARAAEFVKKYQQYAFRLQNRDGSLSTNWFRGRGDEDDIDRRVKTTGHILEWLIYSQEDHELQNSRTVWAVTYLTNLLYSNYDHEWEIGPRSHALHALALYDQRVFEAYDNAEDVAGGATQRQNTSRNYARTRTRR